mmetsp:Transcript_117518/g.230567  ORF Transcript_117518/g.230567 Transcript_117518/m.230567 type:complete len:154 (-) Transcript_117518:180-641(-)
MALVKKSSEKGSKATQKKKKVMKAKRVSKKVARGRMARYMVLKGSREKTVGGLTQEALMKNKRGKVVSKRASANGKMRFKNIEGWLDSVMEARKALHVSGFVAINGKTLQGKALYVKSKALCLAKSGGQACASSTAASSASPARHASVAGLAA